MGAVPAVGLHPAARVAKGAPARGEEVLSRPHQTQGQSNSDSLEDDAYLSLP